MNIITIADVTVISSDSRGYLILIMKILEDETKAVKLNINASHSK